MDNQKKQVVAKLKEAKNVLVTVSANPTVDQLAACLGLTLMLNKLGKHASAVFSGEVPSTLEFLKPEETLETNTNSLRDFIIALDRNKADKLRYKVEDKVVRIFITPYKTSISQDDLEFSEGDFNVDVVVALGVTEQKDIDQAVTAHGNILHDATVISVTTSDESALGSIHWRDPGASGVSELSASLAGSFDKNLLDEQISTAFLTGIVAQTERFSNNLTSSQTMTVSAQLMSAGANQQLVATKLEETPEPEPEPESEPEDAEPIESDKNTPEEPETTEPQSDDGSLHIDHNESAGEETPAIESSDRDILPPIETGEPQQIEDEEQPSQGDDKPSENDPINHLGEVPGQPVSRGPVLEGKGPETSQITANIEEEKLDPSTDPFSLPPRDKTTLSHDGGKTSVPTGNEPKEAPIAESAPAEPPKESPKEPPKHEQTLDEIETQVHSPHAMKDQPTIQEPSEQPLPGVSIDENGMLIHHGGNEEAAKELKPAPGFESNNQPLDMPKPSLKPLNQPPGSDKKDDNAPPPVPPPMV